LGAAPKGGSQTYGLPMGASLHRTLAEGSGTTGGRQRRAAYGGNSAGRCYLRSAFPWLRHVFADGAYAGGKLQKALAKLGKWTIEIVKRSDAARGFVVVSAQPPGSDSAR